MSNLNTTKEILITSLLTKHNLGVTQYLINIIIHLSRDKLLHKPQQKFSNSSIS